MPESIMSLIRQMNGSYNEPVVFKAAKRLWGAVNFRSIIRFILPESSSLAKSKLQLPSNLACERGASHTWQCISFLDRLFAQVGAFGG